MRWMVLSWVVMAAACGDDNTSSNNTANNTNNAATNNAATNNAATNNAATNNAATNNAATNNAATNNAATNNAATNNAATNNAATNNATLPSVADACASDDNCGTTLTCTVQTEAGWTDGYCSKACTSNAECPQGSHCADDSCVKTCTSAADCRAPAYGCFDGDQDTIKECLPLGIGTGQVGDACESYADCAGGELGACIVASGEDFVGGYCTIIGCSVAAGCPTGSSCLDATSPPICLKNCQDASECRDQYQCSQAVEAGNTCVPAGL